MSIAPAIVHFVGCVSNFSRSSFAGGDEIRKAADIVTVYKSYQEGLQIFVLCCIWGDSVNLSSTKRRKLSKLVTFSMYDNMLHVLVILLKNVIVCCLHLELKVLFGQINKELRRFIPRGDLIACRICGKEKVEEFVYGVSCPFCFYGRFLGIELLKNLEIFIFAPCPPHQLGTQFPMLY